MLPPQVLEGLRKLQDFKIPSGSSQGIDLKEVMGDPARLWAELFSIFETHDFIKRELEQSIGKFQENIKQTLPKMVPEILAAAVAQVSNAVDELLFALMTPLLKPLIKKLREILTLGQSKLMEQEKLHAKGPDSDVFAANSLATNPTHTQLAKDHFNHPLHNAAGEYARRLTPCTG